MRVKKTGNWKGARRVVDASRLKRSINEHYSRALLVNGEILRREVVNGIRKNSLELLPISEVTRAARRKGSNVPVADTGDLTGSVNVVPYTSHAVFVGVPKGKKTKDGRDLVRVAEIVHNGTFNPIDWSSPKGRRMFAAMAWKVRKRKKKFDLGSESGRKPGYWYIPPRPFFPKAFNEAAPHFNVTYTAAALKVWKYQKEGR